MQDETARNWARRVVAEARSNGYLHDLRAALNEAWREVYGNRAAERREVNGGQ